MTWFRIKDEAPVFEMSEPLTERERQWFELGIQLGLNVAGGVLMALDDADPVRASKTTVQACAHVVSLLESLPGIAETLAADSLQPGAENDDYEATMERYLGMVVDSIEPTGGFELPKKVN